VIAVPTSESFPQWRASLHGTAPLRTFPEHHQPDFSGRLKGHKSWEK
jgi:hypothetical protein